MKKYSIHAARGIGMTEHEFLHNIVIPLALIAFAIVVGSGFNK